MPNKSFNTRAVTVGLRSVPKNAGKLCTKSRHISYRALASADSRTHQRIPFAVTTRTQTRSMHWPCYCSTRVVGKSGGRATKRIQHCSAADLRANQSTLKYHSKHVLKKRRNPGIRVRPSSCSSFSSKKIYLATVQETAHLSTSQFFL